MSLFLSILSTSIPSVCRERLGQLGTTQGYMDSALLSDLVFFRNCLLCVRTEPKYVHLVMCNYVQPNGSHYFTIPKAA